jgi:hypothetical protein
MVEICGWFFHSKTFVEFLCFTFGLLPEQPFGVQNSVLSLSLKRSRLVQIADNLRRNAAHDDERRHNGVVGQHGVVEDLTTVLDDTPLADAHGVADFHVRTDNRRRNHTVSANVRICKSGSDGDVTTSGAETESEWSNLAKKIMGQALGLALRHCSVLHNSHTILDDDVARKEKKKSKKKKRKKQRTFVPLANSRCAFDHSQAPMTRGKCVGLPSGPTL